MAMYTYECFAVFRFKDELSRKGIYTRQLILMFFIHAGCFVTIFVKTGEVSYLILYAFQQLAVFAVLVLFELFYPTVNRLVINNMCMLLTIGFVILTRLDQDKAIRQFVIAVIAMIIALIIPYLISKVNVLRNLSWLYAIVGIVSLAAVLILGGLTNGSKISYSIAGVTFQPSEFIKIIFVFFIAAALHESSTFLHVVYVTIVAAIHVLILVASRDLGGALIFFVVVIAKLLISVVADTSTANIIECVDCFLSNKCN